MKKSIFAATFCVLSATAILGTSCSKDKKTTPVVPVVKTPQEMILGKWKSTYEGYDDNSNGIWDANEKVTSEEVFYATFKNDGTYTVYSPSDSFTAQYQLLDSTKIISGDKPDTAMIDKLNETTLITREHDEVKNFSFSEFTKVD